MITKRICCCWCHCSPSTSGRRWRFTECVPIWSKRIIFVIGIGYCWGRRSKWVSLVGSTSGHLFVYFRCGGSSSGSKGRRNRSCEGIFLISSKWIGSFEIKRVTITMIGVFERVFIKLQSVGIFSARSLMCRSRIGRAKGWIFWNPTTCFGASSWRRCKLGKLDKNKTTKNFFKEKNI